MKRQRRNGQLATGRSSTATIRESVNRQRCKLQAQLKGRLPRDEKCVDCDRPLYWHDDFIVRGEIWREAGMRSESDYLHESCLEARLGRKLQPDDFILKFAGYCRRGAQSERRQP
jgi:hypothetical protein